MIKQIKREVCDSEYESSPILYSSTDLFYDVKGLISGNSKIQTNDIDRLRLIFPETLYHNKLEVIFSLNIESILIDRTRKTISDKIKNMNKRK